MCSKEAIPSAWKEHHSSSLKMANCLMGCPPFPVEISPLAQTAAPYHLPPACYPSPSGRLFSASSSRTGRNSCHRYSPAATVAPIAILMSRNQRYAGSQIAVAATITAATASAAVRNRHTHFAENPAKLKGPRERAFQNSSSSGCPMSRRVCET